jgi:CheY-like chemotaxis protein
MGAIADPDPPSEAREWAEIARSRTLPHASIRRAGPLAAGRGRRRLAAPLRDGGLVHALVADDDRVTAEILSRTLKRWEFDVAVVSNGAEAWDHLRAATVPTLAILDWMMPEMDGPEVCRRVRAELPLANMYLMLLTARETRGDLVTGLNAGADDYVTKPFDPEELRARVQVGVRILTLQKNLAERVEELQAALSNVKQLRGLLPICSYCKRIRGDDQYWQQLEGYIAEHSDAQFSHGICPTCYATISAELDRGSEP